MDHCINSNRVQPEHMHANVHAVNQLATATSGLVQLVFDGTAGREGFKLRQIITTITSAVPETGLLPVVSGKCTFDY